LGEKFADPLSMYLNDLMTIPVNLAGLPGMSVPCGFDAGGLPVGLQIVGNVLREDLMFQVAYAFEQATEWHKAGPEL
jgi:aspartyl-tRNA(Asn)/glutamyl-tRNA(Gln) amidotransferase subunit A